MPERRPPLQHARATLAVGLCIFGTMLMLDLTVITYRLAQGHLPLDWLALTLSNAAAVALLWVARAYVLDAADDGPDPDLRDLRPDRRTRH